ncbi:MAG TPA: D-isomer specific 2-hydroxyacid dehydrogenase family protein [Micropepsaceae bacterium]|nr:D-isomer specific 2-hydroxyacid dehydrogenase family protein [Micropepsaceae bacterium]
MPRILVESDHFLKILPVILDPGTSAEHKNAVVDFFAHDLDLLAWCETYRPKIPNLYPSEVEFAKDEAEFEERIEEAEIAVVESLKVTREVLARAKRLLIVQKFGTILSNIDVAACKQRRVSVVALARSVNAIVAEHAFALMIALSKRICELEGKVTAEDLGRIGYPIRPYDRRHIGGSNYARIPHLKTLYGATLGIVGLGEVGSELARRANAFKMSIVYYQRTRLPTYDEMTMGARYLALNELMAVSDYIVVQLPLNDSTRGIIGKDELRVVKPGAILVNCARAHLVDREALMEALDSRRLAGAGFDVGYDEPARPDEPLLKYRSGNVILMPHTAIGDRSHGLEDYEVMLRNLSRALDLRTRGRYV